MVRMAAGALQERGQVGRALGQGSLGSKAPSGKMQELSSRETGLALLSPHRADAQDHSFQRGHNPEEFLGGMVAMGKILCPRFS